MAQLIGNNQVKLDNGQVQTVQNGAWYDGQRFLDGQLLGKNEYEPGKFVGQEVRNQSAAAQGVAQPQFDQFLGIGQNNQSGIPVSGLSGATGSSGSFGSAAGTGSNSPINLQSIYDSAYASAGITSLQEQYNKLQTEIDTKKQALADREAEINENPLYSEASRTGRIDKLRKDAENDLNVLVGQQAGLLNQINSARADVETKLNIATKQFDINSSAAQQALSQFNTLLTAGALDNASSGDMASFAVATGIPLSMIQSAVKLSQQKNVDSKLIETTDDAGNVRVSLVQIKDGQLEVVNTSNLGAIGKASGGSLSQTEQQQQIALQLVQDAQSGVPLIDYGGGSDILKIYGPFLDANTIYNLYNANSKYGPAKETLSQLAAYGVKDINKDPFGTYPAPGY